MSWITISIVCNNTQFSLNSIQLECEQFVIHFTEGKVVSKSIQWRLIAALIRGLAKNHHVRDVVKIVGWANFTCNVQRSYFPLSLPRERERSFSGQSKVDKCNRVSLSNPVFCICTHIHVYVFRIFMCTADGMAPNNQWRDKGRVFVLSWIKRTSRRSKNAKNLSLFLGSLDTVEFLEISSRTILIYRPLLFWTRRKKFVDLKYLPYPVITCLFVYSYSTMFLYPFL